MMTKDLSQNIRYHKGHILISINPKIYPLEVVHAAAYAIIDKAYVILDGDPAEEIFVELVLKDKKYTKNIAFEFTNELLNYAVYYNQAKMNKEIRESIIGAVFSTQSQSPKADEAPSTEAADQPKEYETIDDPLGIRNQWTPKNKKVEECK
jgi:His-Xaa-Ser system protein HxsD